MVNIRFSVTKLLLAAAAVGLFFSAIFLGFEAASVNYDLSDINESSFTQFADYDNIVSNYTEITNESLGVQSDQGDFDVIGNLLAKATKPFKVATSGIRLGKDSISSMLQFMSEFLGVDLKIYIQYVLLSIGILVGLGVFIFKVLLKTDDNI